MDQNAKQGLQFFSLHAIICLFRFGGLAQLVRAPASHAGGLGFESLILHHQKNPNTSMCLGSFLFEMAYLAFRRLWMKCSALAGLPSEANQKTRQVYPERGCTCFFAIPPASAGRWEFCPERFNPSDLYGVPSPRWQKSRMSGTEIRFKYLVFTSVPVIRRLLQFR